MVQVGEVVFLICRGKSGKIRVRGTLVEEAEDGNVIVLKFPKQPSKRRLVSLVIPFPLQHQPVGEHQWEDLPRNSRKLCQYGTVCRKK